MTGTKRCTKCSEVKPLDEYHRDASTSDGHARWCKACVRAAGMAYYHRQRSPHRSQASLPGPPFTCEVCGKEFRYPRGAIESRKRRGAPCRGSALRHAVTMR